MLTRSQCSWIHETVATSKHIQDPPVTYSRLGDSDKLLRQETQGNYIILYKFSSRNSGRFWEVPRYLSDCFCWQKAITVKYIDNTFQLSVTSKMCFLWRKIFLPVYPLFSSHSIGKEEQGPKASRKCIYSATARCRRMDRVKKGCRNVFVVHSTHTLVH